MSVEIHIKHVKAPVMNRITPELLGDGSIM